MHFSEFGYMKLKIIFCIKKESWKIVSSNDGPRACMGVHILIVPASLHKS